MIFGLGKKEAAIQDAEKYMRTMFAGMQVPNQVFGDPYIAAFLQVLAVHATNVVYKGNLPDQMTVAAIMAASLDKMVPGYGLAVVKGLVEVGNPAHASHTNYTVGRSEANQYVKALIVGDQVTAHEMMQSFREFATRNYG